MFDAVFELSTHGVGIPCEFAYQQTTAEKRKSIVHWFNGQRPKKAMRNLRKLARSSQARSFWHGQY